MTERDRIELDDELSPSELTALNRLLGNPAVWEDPDPALEDAVVAAIVAEAEAEAEAQATAPSRPDRPDIEVQAAGGRRVRAGGAQRRRGGWGLLTGAAAAALLIIVVISVAAVRRGEGVPEQLLVLVPTALAPDARAQASVSNQPDGTRILLDIHGLPPAGKNEYYALWQHEEGEPGEPPPTLEDAVSAGTFHLHGGGKDRIELWSGVDTEEYPLFTVTLEREGDGPGSSNRVLLHGRLD